jgi:thiol-disulfide isomerase/thioredoxin
MKLLRLFLIFITSLLLSSALYADATLLDSDNNDVTRTSLHGHWVILNYWAPWCGACAEEIPQFNHFYEATKGSDVLLYGIDFDNVSPKDNQAAAKSAGIKYPVLLQDPRALLGLSSVVALPTTFILNPEGVVVKKLIGEINEDYLRTTLAALRKP